MNSRPGGVEIRPGTCPVLTTVYTAIHKPWSTPCEKHLILKRYAEASDVAESGAIRRPSPEGF